MRTDYFMLHPFYLIKNTQETKIRKLTDKNDHELLSQVLPILKSKIVFEKSFSTKGTNLNIIENI